MGAPVPWGGQTAAPVGRENTQHVATRDNAHSLLPKPVLGESTSCPPWGSALSEHPAPGATGWGQAWRGQTEQGLSLPHPSQCCPWAPGCQIRAALGSSCAPSLPSRQRDGETWLCTHRQAPREAPTPYCTLTPPPIPTPTHGCTKVPTHTGARAPRHPPVPTDTHGGSGCHPPRTALAHRGSGQIWALGFICWSHSDSFGCLSQPCHQPWGQAAWPVLCCGWPWQEGQGDERGWGCPKQHHCAHTLQNHPQPMAGVSPSQSMALRGAPSAWDLEKQLRS